MTLPKDPIKADEYKKKISIIISKLRKGKSLPYWWRRKISDANIGKKFSEETKRKMSEAKKGKPSNRKGTIMSEETKEKLRKINTGKHLSKETKLKISVTNKGKIVSESTRKNLSIAGTGRKHSEETKIKLSVLNSNPSTETRLKMRLAKIGTHPTEETRLLMSKRRKKDKNGNWKGGVTPLYKLIRSSKKMQEWTKQIFERDGYRDWFSGCQGALESHHTISFSTLLRKYKIKSVEDAESCPQLWDLNIGITLLKTSHKFYHALYGKGDHVMYERA